MKRAKHITLPMDTMSDIVTAYLYSISALDDDLDVVTFNMSIEHNTGKREDIVHIGLTVEQRKNDA